jgi:hypothetical protein
MQAITSQSDCALGGLDRGLAVVMMTARQPSDSIPRGSHDMTYMRSGDPARNLADYYPAWLDSLAGDVILEGSAMDGFVQGAEAVRTVLVSIRALYDYQEFNSVGPYGENGWIEDYTAGVCGEPIGNVTLVTRNAAGQAQHIVGNYRPRRRVAGRSLTARLSKNRA